MSRSGRNRESSFDPTVKAATSQLCQEIELGQSFSRNTTLNAYFQITVSKYLAITEESMVGFKKRILVTLP